MSLHFFSDRRFRRLTFLDKGDFFRWRKPVKQTRFARMIGMFPKIMGFPPKSSILIGFSIINHPFLGTPIFGNTHGYTQISFLIGIDVGVHFF